MWTSRASWTWVLLGVALATSCKKKWPEESAEARKLGEPELMGIGAAKFAVQSARKVRSETAIKALGLPILESLPVVEDEGAVKPRSADEVAARCVATTACAIKAETHDQQLVEKLLLDFGARPDLSPKERAFIEGSASEQQLADFGRRHESTHVFLWALGYLPTLSAPAQRADAAKEVALIRDKGAAAFRRDARLRSIAEILDQNDLYYRLHWAAANLRASGKSNPRANEEIIVERQRALNWLIRNMNQEWDDVTTDT